MFGWFIYESVFISLWTASSAYSCLRFFLSYVFNAIIAFVSLWTTRLTYAKAPWPILRPILNSFRSSGYSPVFLSLLYCIISQKSTKYFSFFSSWFRLSADVNKILFETNFFVIILFSSYNFWIFSVGVSIINFYSIFRSDLVGDV